MAHGLAALDWAAPWLAAWRDPGEALAAQIVGGCSVAQALNSHSAAPRHFVPQAALPAGVAYEAFIFASGEVPTRDGLHDFFNGLAWLKFPHTKGRLNALQAQQIASTGIAPVRGPARDALTLFDENAALLRAPDALWEALWRKDWADLFGPLRDQWAQAQLVIFGHALTEKLVAPRKAMTAHVYRVAPGAGFAPAPAAGAGDKSGGAPGTCRDFGSWDRWLAAELSAERLASRPFAHLPVLGVPGWWAHNTDPAFYADPEVFRRPRLTLNTMAG